MLNWEELLWVNESQLSIFVKILDSDFDWLSISLFFLLMLDPVIDFKMTFIFGFCFNLYKVLKLDLLIILLHHVIKAYGPIIVIEQAIWIGELQLQGMVSLIIFGEPVKFDFPCAQGHKSLIKSPCDA